jgi:hypothetical protein
MYNIQMFLYPRTSRLRERRHKDVALNLSSRLVRQDASHR